MQMKGVTQSRLLTPPLFAFSQSVEATLFWEASELNFHATENECPSLTSSRALTASGLESYARQLLAQLALDVLVPVMGDGSPLGRSNIIKNHMSPTMKKRLSLVDRRRSVWNAIDTYVQPIYRYVSGDLLHIYSTSRGKLSQLVWALYLLVLAHRTGADVAIDPKQQTKFADALLLLPDLDAESKARLSVIRGIFSAYADNDRVPGLSFVPGSLATGISERLDDIMTDAYLLEASHLRKLFGWRQNLASVRRDLRSLTRFIAKNRPWAKGIVEVARHNGFVGSDAVAEALQAITTLPHRRAPLLIDPRCHISALGATASKTLWTIWPMDDEGESVRISWWDPKEQKWM